MDGKFRVDQGVIAGCSGGTYQNIVRAAQILDGHAIGSDEFWLSVYPTSQPVNLELTRKGGVVYDKKTFRTSLPGVFAAGDCTGGPLQVAKAVGEGHTAGLSAAEYVDRKRNEHQ